ncbi:hypothetical protein [Nostoc sp. NMS8]|uniref:hypothetical protein n=1 Tax=Nostoc sp. NMS8 TaxID=2815392 RepID=UPI0025E1629D|nr:hypothetical protein [Nostoc sp. NMS8]MBN3960882.1 hypothetical protein [Nostoc sp. NMS8]
MHPSTIARSIPPHHREECDRVLEKCLQFPQLAVTGVENWNVESIALIALIAISLEKSSRW